MRRTRFCGKWAMFAILAMVFALATAVVMKAIAYLRIQGDFDMDDDFFDDDLFDDDDEDNEGEDKVGTLHSHEESPGIA